MLDLLLNIIRNERSKNSYIYIFFVFISFHFSFIYLCVCALYFSCYCALIEIEWGGKNTRSTTNAIYTRTSITIINAWRIRNNQTGQNGKKRYETSLWWWWWWFHFVRIMIRNRLKELTSFRYPWSVLWLILEEPKM